MTALTRSDTTVDVHPAVALMNITRRRVSMEPLLPTTFAGTHRCYEATNRVCEGGHCECSPRSIDRIGDLKVDDFVQLTRTPYSPAVGAPPPTFTSYKVLKIDPDGVTLHATSDVLYQHRVQSLVVHWSADSSRFVDSDGDIFMYHYGFISDLRYAVGDPQLTKECSLAGTYTRPVYDLRCMQGSCRLGYDGAEHGIFRLSKQTSFCISLFYLFDQAKITQRCKLLDCCVRDPRSEMFHKLSAQHLYPGLTLCAKVINFRVEMQRILSLPQ